MPEDEMEAEGQIFTGQKEWFVHQKSKSGHYLQFIQKANSATEAYELANERGKKAFSKVKSQTTNEFEFIKFERV